MAMMKESELRFFNSKIPPGYNSDTKELPYAEYRALLMLWDAMTELPEQSRGPTAAGRLVGEAQRLALTIKIDELTSKGESGAKRGLQRLLDTLDAAMGPEVQEKMIESYRKFLNLRRKTMTMMEYTAKFVRLYQDAKGYGLTISEQGLAFFLLEWANLSPQEWAQVLAPEKGKIDKPNELAATLRRLMPKDSQQSAHIIGHDGDGKPIFTIENMIDYSPTPMYCADMNGSLHSENFVGAADGYGDDDSSSDDDNEPPDFAALQQDPKVLEAYLMGQKHRFEKKKFKKTFFKGKKGYKKEWKKKEHFLLQQLDELYAFQKKPGERLNPIDKTTGQVMRCNRCGSKYHFEQSCSHPPGTKIGNLHAFTDSSVNNESSKTAVTSSSSSSGTTFTMFPVFAEEVEDVKVWLLDSECHNKLMLDTGASCNLAGSDWLEEYQRQVLQPQKLWSAKAPSTTRFKGVGGGASASEDVTIPIPLGDSNSAAFTAPVVPGELPGIMGLPAMAKNGTIINLRKMTVTFRDSKGKDIVLPIHRSKSNHIFVDLKKWREKNKAKASEIGAEIQSQLGSTSSSTIAASIPKPLQGDPMRILYNELQNNKEEVIEMILGTRTHWDFLELQGGAGGVTTEMLQLGAAAGPVVDIVNGWNLSHGDDRAALEELVNVYKPSIIMIEPECRPWSLANTTGKTKDQDRSFAKEKLEWFVDISDRQIKNSNDYVYECPAYCHIWHESPLEAMITWPKHIHDQITHMCGQGLKAHDSKKPIMKPTRLAGTIKLQHSITLCKGNHKHHQLRGYDPIRKTSWTRQASKYATKFCQNISKDFMEHLENKHQTGKTKQGQKQQGILTMTNMTLPCDAGKALEQSPKLCGNDSPDHQTGDELPQLHVNESANAGADDDSDSGNESNDDFMAFMSKCMTSSSEVHESSGKVVDVFPSGSKFRSSGRSTAKGSISRAERQAEKDQQLEPCGDQADIQRDKPTKKLNQKTDMSSQHMEPTSSTSASTSTKQDNPNSSRIRLNTKTTVDPTSAIARPIEVSEQPQLPLAKPEDFTVLRKGRISDICLQGKTPEERTKINTAVLKLHLRFWHASSRDMHRMMSRIPGVSRYALQVVQDIVNKCGACREWQRATPSPVVKISFRNKFNERVQTDIFFFHRKEDLDKADRELLSLLDAVRLESDVYAFMFFIDEATRFRMVTGITSRTAMSLINAFSCTWIRFFGPPEELQCDQEGGIFSGTFAAYCERIGTKLLPVGQGQHTTQGLAERGIGLIKQNMRRIMTECLLHQRDCTAIEAASLAIDTCNELLEVGGFSPYQLAFGRQPRRSLENTGAVELNTDNEETDYFEEAIKMKTIARKAFLDAISDNRVRDALAHHKRPDVPSFKVGDKVEVAMRKNGVSERTPWEPGSVVTDISLLERGTISVKRQSGRVLLIPVSRVRPEVATLYCHLADTYEDIFQFVSKSLRSFVADQKKGYSKLHGYYVEAGQLVMLKATQQDPQPYHLANLLAQDIWGQSMPLGAVRFCNGIRSIQHPYGAIAGTLLIWDTNNDKLRIMDLDMKRSLDIGVIAGAAYANIQCIALYAYQRSTYNFDDDDDLTCNPAEAPAVTGDDSYLHVPVPDTPPAIGNTGSQSSHSQTKQAPTMTHRGQPPQPSSQQTSTGATSNVPQASAPSPDSSLKQNDRFAS